MSRAAQFVALDCVVPRRLRVEPDVVNMPGIRIRLYLNCDYPKIVKNVSARDIQTDVMVLRDSKETICVMAERGTSNCPVRVSSIVEIPVEPVAGYEHATVVDNWWVGALCYGNIAGRGVERMVSIEPKLPIINTP